MIAYYRDGQSAIAHELKMIRNDSQVLKTGLSRPVDAMRTDVLEAITAFRKTTLSWESNADSSLVAISQKLLDIQTEVANVPVQHRILQHLNFESISARFSQIHVAEPDTSRWILDDDFNDSAMENLKMKYAEITRSEQVRVAAEKSNRKRIRQQFLDWLRIGDGVLHISGNAGSGKSTLMKFIIGHERTTKELFTWAGRKKLVFGQFFFWSAGSSTQRTLEGLQRSLLFQALSQCPELIGDVFPSQVEWMKIHHDKTVEAVEQFTCDRIREAFDLFITKIIHAKHRFCFFIDGLDECDGTELEHERLAEKLKSWTDGGDVKLCVSSRPWTEFVTTFESPRFSTFHLHLLNRFDIESYCIEQLTKDKFAGQNVDLCRSLAETIVDNAQGIFLWAHLVVHEILLGVRRGGTAKLLMAQVEEMPPQLNELYKKLREPLEGNKLFKTMSNRMLLLAAKYESSEINLNAMAFSWLEYEAGQPGLLDVAFPPANECQPYHEAEITTRLKRVTQLVQGLARGLLEVTSLGPDEPVPYTAQARRLNRSFRSTRVQFCHKTARDYLLGECYDSLLRDFPNFDSVYERVHLAETIYGKDSDEPLDDRGFWRLAPPGFRHVDREIIERAEIILRPYHRSLWHGYRSSQFEARDTPGSFLHCAAYYGLHDFCRSSLGIAKDARSPSHTDLARPDVGTSLLLAVTSSYYFNTSTKSRFGLELLHKRIDTDVLVDAAWKEFTAKLPAWVIACTTAAKATLPNVKQRAMDSGRHTLHWLELLGGLHRHSLEVNQPVTLVVGVLSPVLGGNNTHDSQHTFGGRTSDLPYQRLTLSSGDFIRLMTPSDGTIGRHSPPQLSWPTGLSAKDFLAHASERRWRLAGSSFAAVDLSYSHMPFPFALLAVDSGSIHVVLRRPEQVKFLGRTQEDLFNYRVY